MPGYNHGSYSPARPFLHPLPAPLLAECTHTCPHMRPMQQTNRQTRNKTLFLPMPLVPVVAVDAGVLVAHLAAASQSPEAHCPSVLLALQGIWSIHRSPSPTCVQCPALTPYPNNTAIGPAERMALPERVPRIGLGLGPATPDLRHRHSEFALALPTRAHTICGNRMSLNRKSPSPPMLQNTHRSMYRVDATEAMEASPRQPATALHNDPTPQPCSPTP